MNRFFLHKYFIFLPLLILLLTQACKNKNPEVTMPAQTDVKIPERKIGRAHV